jgi:metal-responsive CopG/Arc/MetJ family transcriptional regulator
MLQELDREVETLSISRQAVIETMLREALDRRHLAQQARQAHGLAVALAGMIADWV